MKTLNFPKILWMMSKESKLKLDVMEGDRWKCTVTLDVTPYMRYEYEELKTFVRMKRPSLEGKEFDIIPCGKPKFRN